MGIYSRAQYDFDLETIERASQQVSCWVVEQAELGNRQAGRQSLIMSAELERMKRECKGKLLSTMNLLSDGDAKSKCLKPKQHQKGCRCANLFKQVEANAAANT
jgi:hypothetical protein